VEVLQKARALQPDVVLMDSRCPTPSGEVIPIKSCELAPKTRVLVLTMHDDPAYLASAMAAGATGYVSRRLPISELLPQSGRSTRGVRLSISLSRWTRRTTHPGRRPGQVRAAAGLEPREREVLRLLAQGYSNQQIATSKSR